MPDGRAAKAFWDERAEEDALWFVDNRRAYGDSEDQTFWSGGEQDLQAVLDSVDARLDAEDEVVEIGCGVGRLTRVIAARAHDVRALDVSPRMLDLARKYNPESTNVEWIEGDGTTLTDIADSSADACISHVVFQHIPDSDITLGYVREIGRILRPGAWAAFQISNTTAVHGRPPVREQVRGLLGRAPKGLAHRNWKGSSVDLNDLRKAAADSKLTVEVVVGEGTQFCMVRVRADDGARPDDEPVPAAGEDRR